MGLLTSGLLTKSTLQSLTVFASSFDFYYVLLANDVANVAVAGSMGLAIIMLANLFLVQINSFDLDPYFSLSAVWQRIR